MRASDDYLDIAVTYEAEQITLQLSGELDAFSVVRLRRELEKALVAEPELPLLIDLAGVTYCDSAGISALVSAHRARNASVRITNAQPIVRRAFEISGLAELLA